MRYCCIGDIHAYYNRVKQFEPYFSACDKIIYVGDALDRGSDTLKTLQFISETPNYVFCLGNHELKRLRKHSKNQKSAPPDIQTEEEYQEFVRLLNLVVGEKPTFYYKDENIAVSHAPVCLYHHDFSAIDKYKFVYGWTTGNKDENGYPERMTLEQKYPGEINVAPTIFGHIHSDRIDLGNKLYCVDLNGIDKIGGVIIENSTVVEMLEFN